MGDETGSFFFQDGTICLVVIASFGNKGIIVAIGAVLLDRSIMMLDKGSLDGSFWGFS